MAKPLGLDPESGTVTWQEMVSKVIALEVSARRVANLATLSGIRPEIRLATEQHRVKGIERVVPRILAALLAGVLVSKWVLLRIVLTSVPWSAVGFMALLFVGLTIASAVGLLLLRNWGFLAVYLLAPFSTIFHGIALVPWITSSLPTLDMRIWAVGVLNALFLIMAAVAHWSLHRATSPLAERRLV